MASAAAADSAGGDLVASSRSSDFLAANVTGRRRHQSAVLSSIHAVSRYVSQQRSILWVRFLSDELLVGFHQQASQPAAAAAAFSAAEVDAAARTRLRALITSPTTRHHRRRAVNESWPPVVASGLPERKARAGHRQNCMTAALPSDGIPRT